MGSATDEDECLNDSDQLEHEKQALNLLKKLQDLKVWQNRQEERLLEEQKNQILSLEQLGLKPYPGSRPGARPVAPIHPGPRLPVTREELVEEDDDTTVSSLAYDEELSTLSEEPELDESEHTWADRNTNRPETKNLNVSNGSVMTLSDDAGGRVQPPQQHTEEEQDDEALEDNEDEEEEEYRENPENQPVQGAGRTFAQLLADQLGVESLPDPSPEELTPPRKPVVKKPFLRRGAGLTRFNLAPDPSQQPSRVKRSKSQPRLSDSDLRNPSRLSQETLSYSCKKTSPKRIVASRSLSKLEDSSSTGVRHSPPAKLKLKSPQLKSPPAKKKSSPALQAPRAAAPKPREIGAKGAGSFNPDLNLGDSVENSFREKLHFQEKRHEKELKELAVFELLEDAANDTSFCSTSSRVKTLMDNSILPSPSRPTPLLAHSTPFQSTSTPFQSTSTPSSFKSTSTPASFHSSTTPILHRDNTEVDENEDPSLGRSLMEDIRRFIMGKNEEKNLNGQDCEHDDEDEDRYKDDEYEEDDDDESTVCDEDNVSIGKNWRERMVEWDKENQENLENGLPTRDIMEFSPPAKMPKNSPSYLIWSIFTREREERKQRNQERQQLSSKGNNVPRSKDGLEPPRSAPAKLCLASKPGSTRSPAPSTPGDQELNYQSTLLQMRVVELEQEIDTFKKENAKVLNLRKKLDEEKQRLTKDWEEFEKVRDDGKKKIEEERRRVRREKMLLDKAIKESTTPKVCSECKETKSKYTRLQQDLSSKENKWTAALVKLQEQLQKVEKEKNSLQNENQKLRIKTVSSKITTVSSATGSKTDVKVVSHPGSGNAGSDKTPDSGIRSIRSSGTSSEDEYLDQELRQSISSSVYAALSGDTPRLSYSPADSLDSSVTLVSGFANITPGREDDLAPGREFDQENDVDLPKVVNNSERGTREKRFPDGRLEIWYANGNRKEVSADGKTVKVFYYNGDLKETHSDGVVKYLYSQTQTWHTTYPDSREVLHFSNGQEEIRYPDGSMQISFPDGSVKKISRDGCEDIHFPDGTRVEVGVSGDRVLHLPNGQREEHSKDMKKRVYPDGTLKILYTDGRQETRYSNGRIRIKDGLGKLIKDSHS
ncbi:centromere protein J isoform X3 [Eurytemora carolleeae]|uniref:centromere protein J isoform X3 n=1 Tax=Eurytemora carolleeae TaxID=1294199 RepID=UPI000C762A43|nr:centromere protein J isoform X3 [Eurytemora carolleeae]|eukprot:XP_023336950.1 centromere protein J-like isoform X3 [Eurytemora affinis]